MIKMISLLKRRSGMSMQEFIEYYESRHARIGEKYLVNYALHYERRFLHQLPDHIAPATEEKPFDVVMEIWFENLKKLEACFEVLLRSEVQSEIIADEEMLFNREHMYSYIVEEHESALAQSST